MRKHVLVESEGIMSAHRKQDASHPSAPAGEKEIRTVAQLRKPGQGKPQNPPPKEPSKK